MFFLLSRVAIALMHRHHSLEMPGQASVHFKITRLSRTCRDVTVASLPGKWIYTNHNVLTSILFFTTNRYLSIYLLSTGLRKKLDLISKVESLYTCYSSRSMYRVFLLIYLGAINFFLSKQSNIRLIILIPKLTKSLLKAVNLLKQD